MNLHEVMLWVQYEMSLWIPWGILLTVLLIIQARRVYAGKRAKGMG